MERISSKVFLALSGCVLLLTIHLVGSFYSISHRHAQLVLEQQAELALSFELAVRDYLAAEIRPEMYKRVNQGEFSPEAFCASFASRSIFERVKKRFPELILKFSSDNPRNPKNLAGPEELALIGYFNEHPERKEWSGPITMDGKKYMAKFRARRMTESCLQCHGDPSLAPASLVEQYGQKGGFHRQMSSVIALDTIAIPMEQTVDHVWVELKYHIAALGFGLFLFLTAIVLSFRGLVIKRLSAIADHFKETAELTDYAAIEPVAVNGRDEIAVLARSYNQLAEKLKGIYGSLESQVRQRTADLERTNASLRSSGAFHRTVLDSLNDAVAIIDVKTFNIVGVNRIFCRDYGVEESEAVGQPCYRITHGIDRPCTPPNDPCPLLQTARTGEHSLEEHLHTRADGSRFYVEVATSPIFGDDNKVERVVHVARDISLRKAAELAREEAKTAAEEANRAKSEFLANMSHEIRTPLNGIIGMMELAMDTELDDHQKNIFYTIDSEANALLAIINDILDFSKIEAGRLELEEIPFDLRNLVEDVAASIAYGAEQKHLEFITYIPPDMPNYLVGDPGRLRQILRNLGNNAVKFTEEGEIFIKGECVDVVDDRVTIRFEVRDTGIGIAPEKHNKIFESFSQADGSTTRKYGGTGLGTAISKQLTELMGGEIGLESELGKGSTFWFTVRMAIAPVHARPEEKKVDLQGKLLLVVDDNQTNLLILTDYFESWGCRVERAESGRQALAIIEKMEADKPFDLVVTDFHMPEMDGFELARALRTGEKSGSTPIIILTSVGNIGDGMTCREIGVDGYLTKPVRRDELRRAVESVFKNITGDRAENRDKELITRHLLADRLGKKSFRILLVEDYPTNQKVARRQLEHLGYLVDLAEDGGKAVEVCKRHRYDLVLMDVQMPVMDGYEATRQIRAFEETQGQAGVREKVRGRASRVPIIAMTAHATKEDRNRCLAAGMDDFLAKPLTRKDLVAKLSQWLFAGEGEEAAGESADRTAPGEAAPQAGIGQERADDPGEMASGDSPPLDWSRALAEFGDDLDFLVVVTSEFLAQGESQVRHLRQALAENNREVFTRNCHSLKGGAANLAAVPLSRVAARAEQAAKENRLAEASPLIEEIEEELARLSAFFKDTIK